jgi:endonuclease/exonuclease/phosphatase family metal-dependent hydrolase
LIKPFLRSVLVLAALSCTVAPAAAAVTVVMDAPRANTTVRVPFALGGWALDTASTSGTGVSTMHVWAFPVTGAAPVFLGVTGSGARPDVAAIYGSRFLQSGFNLAVYSLAPGAYTVVVYPFSTRLNAFDYARAYALPLSVTTGTVTTTTTSGTALRVLQWNLHHSVGTDGVYNPDRIATWTAKMNPDVVMFNEIEKYTYWGNQDQPELYKALLQQKTGRTWYYLFAQEFGQWSSNGKGNLILSRFPISAADRYELTRNYDRSIAMAAITVAGIPVTLINTHLDPYDQALRLTQASEVTWWSGSHPENRIITGDMNAWPDQTSIAHFNQSYYDSWAVAASQGTAVAFSGNSGQTKSGRIDYIFYSKGSRNLSVKSSQVYDTRDANGVMPSDHRPVVTTFIVK